MISALSRLRRAASLCVLKVPKKILEAPPLFLCLMPPYGVFVIVIPDAHSCKQVVDS
jgi:hypothetical protein